MAKKAKRRSKRGRPSAGSARAILNKVQKLIGQAKKKIKVYKKT